MGVNGEGKGKRSEGVDLAVGGDTVGAHKTRLAASKLTGESARMRGDCKRNSATGG